MKHLIFVDRRIRGRGGHNLEYCLRVAEAMRPSGYQATVLGGRDFKGERPGDVALLPALRWDWSTHALGQAELEARRAEAARRSKRRRAERRAAWRNSAVGRLFTYFYELRAGVLDAGRLGALTRPLMLFAVLLEAARFVARVLLSPLAMARWGLRRIARLAPVRWTRFRLGLVRQRGRDALKRDLQGFGLVRVLLTQRTVAGGARRFSRSLEGALSKLRPDASDLVLFTTCDKADLDAALAALGRRPELRAATWHFVMREPLDVGGSSVFVLSQSARLLRNTLAELNRVAPGAVRLWADTAELVQQYDQLGVGKVGELPVAVPDDIFALNARGAEGSSVVVGYLGDAREEKGFGRLPDLVENMSRRLGADELQYLVQTNFNIAGGTRTTRGARLRLRSFDNLGVRTLDAVQGQAAYHRNLAACDVLLMCYDSPLYIAGSSGVVAEALAAGRPVIVHDATWSGRQLRTSAAFSGHARALADAYTGLALQHPVELELSLPQGADAVVVAAEMRRRAPGDPFTLTTTFSGLHTRIVRRRLCSSEAIAYVVLRVPQDAALIRFDLERVDPTFTLSDVRLRVHFCTLPAGVAIGAVGAGISSWDEAPDALEEIVRHYPHYRRTAGDCSVERRRDHGMTALADRLIASTAR